MARYYLNTEFIEDGKTIDLVSIGITNDTSQEYYAISTEFDPSKANNWVVNNVLSKLPIFPKKTMPDAMHKNKVWQPQKMGAGKKYTAKEHLESLLWRSREDIAIEVLHFLLGLPPLASSPFVDWSDDKVKDFLWTYEPESPIEIWTYYGDYDWVVFCQLFGAMADFPKGLPMYAHDLKQEIDRLGVTELPKQQNEHSAIADAHWNKEVRRYLDQFSPLMNIK